MMSKTTAVRNELGPLLEALIVQLDGEGCMTQRAHFDRIRRSLYLARTDSDLARPIFALSTSTVYGFKFSNDADALVSRIIEKIAELEVENGTRPRRLH